MNPTVYIETSVISYLTARPSRDARIAANQKATHEWWQNERHGFNLVSSLLVLDEIRQGDHVAATARLSIFEPLRLVRSTFDADRLTSSLLANLALPEKARVDAAHIAIAAVNSIDFLLTWNCQHINNVFQKPRIRAVCADSGFRCPEICSPVDMIGGAAHEQ